MEDQVYEIREDHSRVQRIGKSKYLSFCRGRKIRPLIVIKE